jgi:hypothetical protein
VGVKASHVPDNAEFKLLFSVLSWSVLVAVFSWTIYIALEPYVRRRWPHAIISWSRVLEGRFRDPVVGGHILLGAAFGAVTVVLVDASTALAGAPAMRLPSTYMLSAATGSLAYCLGNLYTAVLQGMGVLFLTFCFKLFFRREWLVALLIAAIAIILEEPVSPLPPVLVGLICIPIALGYTYLLLRSGLWSVIVAMYTALTLLSLPLSGDLSAPGAAASILVLCSLGGLALFGFHSTLAGRPVFRLDM